MYEMYEGFHHELGTRLALNSLGELALTNKTWRTPTDMEATKYLCKSSLSTCESAQRDPGTASAQLAALIEEVKEESVEEKKAKRERERAERRLEREREEAAEARQTRERDRSRRAAGGSRASDGAAPTRTGGRSRAGAAPSGRARGRNAADAG